MASAGSSRPAWGYQPLVPAAVAYAVGIALDHWVPGRVVAWLVAAAAALAAWLLAAILERRLAARASLVCRRVATLLLLVSLALTGAARHHAYWWAYPADDIGHWAGEAPRPARLRGVLADEPLVVARDRPDPLRSQPAQEHTIAALSLREIDSPLGWRPASGRAHLVVLGTLAGVHAGDRVEVLGDLAGPPRPSNPGEFDYASFLRGRGTRAVVHCKLPESVAQQGGPGQWLGTAGWQRAAGWAERRLRSRLDPARSRIAVALLLGRYELMEEDVTELFVRTGTMHILAISGQHLAILAGFLWLLVRALRLPLKAGAIGVGLVVVGYAMLTGCRAPVLRAAVLVCVLVASIVLDRRGRRANSLALAVLVVLALNPSDLFDGGFQLSFLAVVALVWIVRPTWIALNRPGDPLTALARRAQPAWRRAVRAGVRFVLLASLLSGLVWLANAPLLAARFHLVSPIVVPLTVLLTPAVDLALIAGLGFLITDPWAPQLASLLARACGWGLGGMERCVRWGALVPLGYAYVPGPPAWWLVGFYAGFAVLLLTGPRRRTLARWAAAVLVWAGVGFLQAGLRPPPGRLECQVLAVGNGSAAVLRLPNGHAVLVDAGQIAGPRVGSRLIAPALWEEGIRRLDAVFISHADIDHFNGIPHLIERFPVGTVFVPPHFAHSSEEAVRITCDCMGRSGVPIRVCWASQRFELSPGVVATVLHPPVEFGGSDNEQSLVLDVDYMGQRILLPGDVEGNGLRAVLRTEPRPAAVLIAPHHGSRRANPPELIDWCRPAHVVVSQGRPRSGATLDAYHRRGVPVHTSNEQGAIAILVDPAGVRIRPFRAAIQPMPTDPAPHRAPE